MKKMITFFAALTLTLVLLTSAIMTSARVQALTRATENLQMEFVRVNEQQVFLLAAFCNETNMRSKKPQELSHDQCLDYARSTYLEMKRVPTPTALQRETSRRGLGVPEPTPCRGDLPCGVKK
jgi:hypothetical protein